MQYISFVILILLCSPTTGAEKQTKFDINSACRAIVGNSACITPTPFQPKLEDIDFISRPRRKNDKNIAFQDYGENQKVILVENIPFVKYWRLSDPDVYVFHPMAWGRYIFANAGKTGFSSKLPDMTSLSGTTLPSGALAFYYPNHYPLNRMRGPDFVYSAISQSNILAGYLQNEHLSRSAQFKKFTKGVKDSFFFPHEIGGVNLENIALLELPLFRSSPEIILNGWIHALLHINDYAIAKYDSKLHVLIEHNLHFFIQNHGLWYDEFRNISCYSDTSPHQVIIDAKNTNQSFFVVNTPRVKPLKNYVFAPVEDFNNEYSGFDTKIIHVDNISEKITLSLTCSQHFDTWLVSNAPFSLKIRGGGYDPLWSIPTAEGRWNTLYSAVMNENAHAINIQLEEDELICGYPTDFSKSNNKNYYHVHHIVALLYLAKVGIFKDSELSVQIRAIALDWYARTKKFSGMPINRFESPQKVLDGINRGKFFQQVQKISELGIAEWGN